MLVLGKPKTTPAKTHEKLQSTQYLTKLPLATAKPDYIDREEGRLAQTHFIFFFSLASSSNL